CAANQTPLQRRSGAGKPRPLSARLTARTGFLSAHTRRGRCRPSPARPEERPMTDPPAARRPLAAARQVLVTVLARLRFVAILGVIGLVIVKWDTLRAYYEKWSRPA